MFRLIIDHAAVQNQIVIAGYDDERIDLYRFRGMQGLSCACEALPTPTGPQALPAQDVTACSCGGDR